MASTPLHKSTEDLRSKSCETACSSNSSCFFRKRKPMNPLAGSLRSCLSRSTASTGNGVRQRVMSAKMLKLRTVQNQLNDANFHLAEAMRENQALKTLQKRQDKALSKYEGTKADLPRILHVHEEEIRTLSDRNKTLKKTIKELTETVKTRNDEVLNLQEQLKRFEKLDKNKNLLEREKLIEQVDDLKEKLQKADDEIVMLNRKLALETKSCKQKLSIETAKSKQSQKELTQCLTELGRLTKLLESKDRLVAQATRSGNNRRLVNLPQRQSHSMVSLNNNSNKLLELASSMSSDKCPVTDVKLEPILKKADLLFKSPSANGILVHPSENIKARLSSGKHREPAVAMMAEDIQETESEPVINEVDNNIDEEYSDRIDKLSSTLHSRSMQKNDDNRREFDKRLGDYCLEAIDSVKSCNDAIDAHREKLESAKSDTEKLRVTFKEVEELDRKLRMSENNNREENVELVTQILNDELVFQKTYNPPKADAMRNGTAGGLKDKSRLLATLRAIDNGDSLDSFDGGLDEDVTKNRKLLKELWGDAAD